MYIFPLSLKIHLYLNKNMLWRHLFCWHFDISVYDNDWPLFYHCLYQGSVFDCLRIVLGISFTTDVMDKNDFHPI
jgi:hypothetical protein